MEIKAIWYEVDTQDPNKPISQGCEMENEIKCSFCEKSSAVVPYMVANDNGAAICSSCVRAASERILIESEKTFMELDKAKRYVKLLEEKSGILSLD